MKVNVVLDAWSNTRRTGCSSRSSLCRFCNLTLIIIIRICNPFCCQNIFPDTIQQWIFITRRVSRPRRESKEGSKSHHTLFRWVYSFCVASLSGRWSIGCLVTALRGLRPLVPCYARSRPYRDADMMPV